MRASQDIGSASNFFDVQVSGDFSGQVGHRTVHQHPDHAQPSPRFTSRAAT